MTISNNTSSSSPVIENGLAERVRRGRKPRVRQETHEPEREPEGRAARIPLGVQRIKGETSQRPGFSRRWINDDGARIQQALVGGWDFVTKDHKAQTSNMGEAASQIAGHKEGGGPLIRYLMEIRQDWFDADQATKQEKVDATENQIRRGELVGKVGKDGVYVPKQGISIKRAG